MQRNESRPARIGIIGCGNVLGAYVEALAPLRARGAAEVAIACGRDHQRERVLRDYGISRFTTNHLEVIDDPAVEVVVILTSMPSHSALVLESMARGKHVLVEKPMAVNLDEAARVLDAARRGPGLLACAPFTVLSPTFQAISGRIRRGDAGKVVSARARYGWSGPDWAEWFYKPGGGALFDLGVYSVTSLTGLLGPVKRVSAMAGAAVPVREVAGRPLRLEAEDNAHVTLDFGDAVFATVTTGFTIQQYRCPAIELYGTEGTVQMLGDDWDPDGYEIWMNSASAWHLHKETDPNWPWTDGLRHLLECVREGKKLLATPEHAFHVLEVLLKAQTSAREGRVQEVRSTFEPPLFEAKGPPESAHRIHDRTTRREEPS